MESRRYAVAKQEQKPHLAGGRRNAESFHIPDTLTFLCEFLCSLGARLGPIDQKGCALQLPSTFSGTHFVTPRTYTAEIGFHF
jgi:hypothetical protein